MRGTTATSDELTGNFGSALEGTSIGDCRLTALFAEKLLQANFGVLQHYPAHYGLKSDITQVRKVPQADSSSILTVRTLGRCKPVA